MPLTNVNSLGIKKKHLLTGAVRAPAFIVRRQKQIKYRAFQLLMIKYNSPEEQIWKSDLEGKQFPTENYECVFELF